MSRVVLVDVLCCCGWRGPLPTRAACPSCGADPKGRVTKARLDKLRAVHRGERVTIPPNMRTWLVRNGLMVVRAAPGGLKLTALGELVLAAAARVKNDVTR